jgi:non-specific serine/threonine protein kinase
VYDDAERARVNVTKRIRAAIAAVAEHDPRLERHLRGAIRTGVFCSYAPAPEATASWSL